MDNVWMPFLSALFGAIIGSATSVLVVVVQTRAEHKRERLRLAVQAAIEDHKRIYDLATRQGRAYIIQPLSSYIHYHASILELLDKGRLSPDALLKLNQELEHLGKIAEETAKRNNPSIPL